MPFKWPTCLTTYPQPFSPIASNGNNPPSFTHFNHERPKDMKVASYQPLSDGTASPSGPVLMERLTFDAFKRIHGGDSAALPDGWCPPPQGFGLWKTSRGQYMAIRDEG